MEILKYVKPFTVSTANQIHQQAIAIYRMRCQGIKQRWRYNVPVPAACMLNNLQSLFTRRSASCRVCSLQKIPQNESYQHSSAELYFKFRPLLRCSRFNNFSRTTSQRAMPDTNLNDKLQLPALCGCSCLRPCRNSQLSTAYKWK